MMEKTTWVPRVSVLLSPIRWHLWHSPLWTSPPSSWPLCTAMRCQNWNLFSKQREVEILTNCHLIEVSSWVFQHSPNDGLKTNVTLLRISQISRYVLMLKFKDGMGWDRLSGTGVATALKIIYWPTPFLTRPEASRLGGLFQWRISSTAICVQTSSHWLERPYDTIFKFREGS